MSSPPPSHRFDHRLSSAALPLLCTVLVHILAACLFAAPVTAQTQYTEDDTDIQSITPAQVRTFPAILLPSQTALLRTKYDGVVDQVNVSIGAVVSKGQLLARLVDQEERVQKSRAEVLLEKAEADLSRTRRLHERGGASDEALEEAETTYSVAKADLELARIHLEEHHIRAPFKGILAERYVDPGTSVEAGNPLLRVTALSPLRLEALLPETMLPAFAGPTVVELRMSFPDTVISVSIDLGAIVVDPASGTFPLQLLVNNDEGRLVPGVSCTVAIPVRSHGSP